jgi:hypothetical protein
VTADGVYHADPHRGNVLLTTDGQLALEVMLREAERRLEPNEFLAWLFTQLEPITRLPSSASSWRSSAPGR